ncbi:MAG: hypothetical protein KDD45_17645, partial [Bdellovibrionales bacterium]|nr:hypothetical protein [Bdellovibrionales bacterium]
NSMGIAHSYTLETSLFGWKNEEGNIKHFNEEDYQHLANSLLQSLFILEASPSKTMKELGVTK